MYISHLVREQCARDEHLDSVNCTGVNSAFNTSVISKQMIAVLNENFTIETANTPRHLEEAHRLRYQTYCVERGYEASSTGLEVDEFDARSRHVVLRHHVSDRAVGTVRLVLPRPEAPHDSLPMQRLCNTKILLPVPASTTAEISRFAVPKGTRRTGATFAPLMRLGLLKGLLQISCELGLTHWCAVMERPLLRLLRATSVHFLPAGPLVEHRGHRQPSYAKIDRILVRLRVEQAAAWDFLTDGGRLGHGDVKAVSV